MYRWRKLTEEERVEALLERKARKVPWHAPPHREYAGEIRFIITATCFEHKPIIGISPERLAECEDGLIKLCESCGVQLYAWSVLPNHYHLLIQTDDVRQFQSKALGKFHGLTSFKWNNEDGSRGRKVWYKSLERPMNSNRHFFASLNYIHHNPVKHGYVTRWQDWTYSSAARYLAEVGREKAAETWREYPILDMGKDWDED